MTLLHLVVLFAALWEQQVLADLPDNRVQLHLLNILPYPDSRPNSGWGKAYELIPAAKLAVQQINDAPHILPGYKLSLVNVDAEACGVSFINKGLVNTYANVFDTKLSQNVVAFTGLFCSTVTNALTPIFGAPNVTYLQLAASTVPLHRNTDKFPWLVHFISPSNEFNDAVVAMMREFRWTKINVVFEPTNIFHSLNAADLRKHAEETLEFNITTYIDIPITAKTDSILTMVNSRIVYVSASYTDTAKLMCKAYERKAVYPGYIYIFPEGSVPGILSRVGTTNCTLVQITQALEGALVMHYRLVNKGTKLVSNLTYMEYYQEYLLYLEEMESALNESLDSDNVYANVMYDEIWAFALALRNAFNALQTANISLGKLELQRTRQFADILRSKFEMVSFEGASGFVRFNSDREESTVVEVYQFINGTEELVRVYDPDSSEKQQFLKELTLPPDSFETRTLLLPLWESTFFMIFIAACLFVTTFVVVFLHTFKDRPEVKASSRPLSLAMIAGCYLLFMSTLTRNITRGYTITNFHVFTLLCNVQMWFVVIGLTLIFSALLLRLLRVNRIFKAYGKVSPYWKDKYMAAYMLAFCFVEVAILVVWTVVDKIGVQTTTTYQPDATPRFFEKRSICTCDMLGIWLALSLFYIGILVMLNVVLAVQTRKIRLSNFKNTKQINAFIVLTCITLGLLFPLWYIIDAVLMYNVLGHLIFSFALSCTGVYCQLFLFLPLVSVTLRNRRTDGKRGNSDMMSILRRESQFHRVSM